MSTGNANARRTYSELRASILYHLLSGQKTINQLALKTDINWRTVELHLTYLCGRNLCQEVLSSKYVRIFAITDEGRDMLARFKHKLAGRENTLEATFTVNK
jgi:predicted transcriptional regulator